jgi:hypothetical protein
MNSFRYYEASARPQSHITDEESICYNFMCRLAIRKMQELKSEIHREFVEGHYYRQALKRLSENICKDDSIVESGLIYKLNTYPNTAMFWKWAEDVIEDEVKDLYELNSTVLVWCVFPAKWNLIREIEKKWNELDYFISRPSIGAIEYNLSMEDVSFNFTPCDKSEGIKNKKNKKNYFGKIIINVKRGK